MKNHKNPDEKTGDSHPKQDEEAHHLEGNLLVVKTTLVEKPNFKTGH
jgi:hypothetical protein